MMMKIVGLKNDITNGRPGNTTGPAKKPSGYGSFLPSPVIFLALLFGALFSSPAVSTLPTQL